MGSWANFGRGVFLRVLLRSLRLATSASHSKKVSFRQLWDITQMEPPLRARPVYDSFLRIGIAYCYYCECA